MPFPDSFVWGVATSSHQIEGAPSRHGGGLSIWDTFCTVPGRVTDNANAFYACDHYERFPEDVHLIRDLNVQAYRFSVAWPRVLPAGTGRVNQAGLDFYSRLVDRLLDAGITPYVTLFHWDYPFELFLQGGWMSNDSPKWFGDYTEVMTRTLGDRVANWLTLNEPQCFVAGHATGKHAPGLHLDDAALVRVVHNILNSHAAATSVLRSAIADERLRIGLATVGIITLPEHDSPENTRSAYDRSFSASESRADQLYWNNSVWLDPLVHGEYPAQFISRFERYLPRTWQSDVKSLKSSLDFVGTNLYHGKTLADQTADTPESPKRLTAMNWPVTPSIMYYAPKFLWQRYRLPILVAENGLSCRDWVSPDGQVHDQNRIDFIREYLLELHRSIAEGVPVIGYFHWSLMDNFEWTFGYRERFGLIHVDYATQRRVVKNSGKWYAQVVQSNGETLFA